MKLIPQLDRVLIKPHDNLKNIGGLIIPENTLQKRRIGTVIAVGNGLNKETPVYIPLQSEVMYNINAGTPINIDGVEHLLMSQEEILVVFDGVAKLGFRVLTTRIMILPDPIETKIGNLDIPRMAQQISRRGIVVAVGEKIKDEMLPFEEGDYCAYYGNAGSGIIGGEEFKLSADKNYLILRPVQILGKFLTQ